MNPYNRSLIGPREEKNLKKILIHMDSNGDHHVNRYSAKGQEHSDPISRATFQRQRSEDTSRPS